MRKCSNARTTPRASAPSIWPATGATEKRKGVVMTLNAFTATKAASKLLFVLLTSAALTTVCCAQQTQIQRGEYLARAGDCVSCHTAKNGAPYSGGLRMDTPFGYLLSPNITPDRETGIGA